jgi:hypothetical protein
MVSSCSSLLVSCVQHANSHPQIYAYQTSGNNIAVPSTATQELSPGYSWKNGFSGGAQNDIFSTTRAYSKRSNTWHCAYLTYWSSASLSDIGFQTLGTRSMLRSMPRRTPAPVLPFALLADSELASTTRSLMTTIHAFHDSFIDPRMLLDSQIRSLALDNHSDTRDVSHSDSTLLLYVVDY